MEWLHQHGSGCKTDAMDIVAQYGHLDVVKWLKTNRSEGFTTAALSNAIQNGHLHVLAFLCDQMDDKQAVTTALMNDDVRLERQLHIIRWACAHDGLLHPSDIAMLFRRAMEQKETFTCKWLYEHYEAFCDHEDMGKWLSQAI